jgi:hypothetical protein
VTPPPPRYGRLRLDDDLDEFHHALNALKADTCNGGICPPMGSFGICGKHQQREQRRRLRLAASNGEVQDGGGST